MANPEWPNGFPFPKVSFGYQATANTIRTEMDSGRVRVRRRFLREARAVSRLSHPHIVRLLAVGGQEGTPYLAMELLEGQSLVELIRNAGPLPLPL
jgi:serine/threonine-protein kinase